MTRVGWWSSWASPLYRAFQVQDRYGRTVAWRGPVKQTRDQAATFALDLQESNWDKVITSWTYENGRWRIGL